MRQFFTVIVHGVVITIVFIAIAIVTVFTGTTDGLHWGYVFDAPGEHPPVVAHYWHSDTFEHAVDGAVLTRPYIKLNWESTRLMVMALVAVSALTIVAAVVLRATGWTGTITLVGDGGGGR